MAETWVREVLRFWFEEATPEQWFRKDDAFDAAMRARFLALHERLQARPVEDFLDDAETAMAAVIVFDQMSRNMFRGTARAFASDASALIIADTAIARGYEAALSKEQRQFLYLPFEHAENLAAQERCVVLMQGLGDAELVKWAEAHRGIIARFGRFPHRNQALGRASTPEEIAFLKEPGSSF